MAFEINKENKLLGDFPYYISGEKKFSVPVYAVWGNHEDVQVLRQLNTDLKIDNLSLLDEHNFYQFHSDDEHEFSLYGLGGNFLVSKKLFDKPISIAFYLIKELPNSGAVKSSPRFDGLSVALLILMLFSTYYLLDASTSIKTLGVNSLTNLIASIILLISVPAFIFHSKRSNTPFIDFSIFKITEFRAAVVSRFFTMGIYIATLFFVTTIIQTHYKYSAFETGIILVPIMLALTFFSMVSGKIANTGRLKQTLLLGLVIMGIGTFLFYVGTTNIYALVFASIILAVGLALSTPPLATVAISCLDQIYRGVASGVIFTVNMFGALFGLMLANFIIHTKLSTELLSNGYDVAFSDLSLITTILIAPPSLFNLSFY